MHADTQCTHRHEDTKAPARRHRHEGTCTQAHARRHMHPDTHDTGARVRNSHRFCGRRTGQQTRRARTWLIKGPCSKTVRGGQNRDRIASKFEVNFCDFWVPSQVEAVHVSVQATSCFFEGLGSSRLLGSEAYIAAWALQTPFKW